MNNQELNEQAQFEQLIQGLITTQYGCCHDFLLPATIIGLRDNIQALHDAGNMQASKVGNNADIITDHSVRSDKINWINTASKNNFEVLYLQKIERFILYLNESCFTSIKSFESHYSIYQKKDFYQRHLDQFKSEKGRQFSIVLYLNENWKTEDGGHLTLYPKEKEQLNISPVGGKMVFFRSDEMEHEVHPSLLRERYSIAAWLKN